MTKLTRAGSWYGASIHERDKGNEVGCDNEVEGTGEGLSNVDCADV
jgi:hypothetical protein